MRRETAIPASIDYYLTFCDTAWRLFYFTLEMWESRKKAFALYRSSRANIKISRDHHVGTRTHPYHTDGHQHDRREAIEAGLKERMKTKSDGEARRTLKLRMNALRTLHRNTPDCHALEEDMRWFDKEHNPGGKTNEVCPKSGALRKGNPFYVRLRFVPEGSDGTYKIDERFLPFFRTKHFVKTWNTNLKTAWCDVNEEGFPSVSITPTNVEDVQLNRAKNTYDVYIKGVYKSESPLTSHVFWSEAFKCFRHANRAGGVTFASKNKKKVHYPPGLAQFRELFEKGHHDVDLVGLKLLDTQSPRRRSQT